MDDKPVNNSGYLDMSESLCFDGPTEKYLVFQIISRCSCFYSSAVLLFKGEDDREGMQKATCIYILTPAE